MAGLPTPGQQERTAHPEMDVDYRRPTVGR